MENLPQEKFNIPSQEYETRVLTPQEILDLSQKAEFLDINIHKIAEVAKDDPSINITLAETVEGMPMWIEVKEGGQTIFFDDLNFWRTLKAQKQKPKDTIH